MDSFLGLFDPGFKACDGLELISGEDSLPPESEVGNVEYKLKLVNPTRSRFDHLVTQVRFV